MELTKIGMFAGMGLLVIASAGLFIFDRPEIASTGIFLLGTGLLIVSVYKYIGCGPKFDERIFRIITVSMAYSWLTLLAYMATTLILQFVGINIYTSAIRMISMVTFLMVLFYGANYVTYSRKGDVDQ